MKAKITTLFLFASIIFSACTQSAELTSAAQATKSINVTDTSFGIAAPSETPAPVATPTPSIPIKTGSVMPVSINVFTKETIKNVEEIGIVQNGYCLTRATSDQKNVFIVDKSGISYCEMEIVKSLIQTGDSSSTGEPIYSEANVIVPCQNILKHWDIFMRVNDDQTYNATDFAITPSGSHFLVVTSNRVQIFDQEGNMMGELPIPESKFDAALSVDGKYVALTYLNAVHILRVSDAQAISEIDGTKVEFSEDGKYLAVQKRMAVYLYSIPDFLEVYSFPQDAAVGWAISGDGKIIANIVGKDLVVHNLIDGSYSHTIKGFGSRFRGNGKLILSPNGQYALNVFIVQNIYSDYSSDFEAFGFVGYQGNEIDQYDESASYGNYKIYMGADGSTRIITNLDNLSVDNNFFIYYLNFEKPWKYQSSTQKMYFTKDGDVLLYTTYPDKPYTHPSEVCVISNSLYTTCDSGGIIMDYEGKIYQGNSSGYPKDNINLKTANIDPKAGDTGILYSSYDQIEINEKANFGAYELSAVNLQNRFFIGSYKFNDRVVDMNTGEILNMWKQGIDDTTLSPDSRYVGFLYSKINSSDVSRLGIYDYVNNEFKLFHNEYRPSAFAFTNDSTRLFGIINETTQDGIDKIVAYPLGDDESVAETIAEFSFKDNSDIGRFNTLALSPDEKLILAGTDNGYILAFDPANGSLIHQWQAHENSSVLAVAFSPDGKTIYTSSEYGEIKVWGNLPLSWK